MQTSSGAKNPPWARPNVNTNITGINPQIMDPNSMMSQQSMMPFQQTQSVFNPNMMQTQSGMAMPMAGQMQMNQISQGQMYPGNVVAYPTPRGMNPGLYQNAQTNPAPQGTEQRVFTGTVTKTLNDFGFVDHDVFYQTSVCAKGVIPKVNDRVLVEATYNTNMPFKWNATRVQVLPKATQNQKTNAPKSNSYNAVPPPSSKKSLPSRRDDRPSRRDDRKRSRTRSRSRSRDRRESRNRRDSPPRKRPVMHQPSPVKYVVRVPRIPLDIQKADVPGLSQRYNNLYIPSDFFNAHVKWGETFPPQAPFSLNNPCSYHIMNKEVDNPNQNDTVLEPPDADYRFSAKVMLISMPALESLYQKCGLTKVDEKDKRSSKSPLHPTRLIKFLVGQKGKGGENFAIGGPWSPSLDGENPQTDPGVLVKTAIRTCKALTGIDLTTCTQWYRMVEFYYWREGSGGKSRLECVVLFLPDVWSAQPSRIEWTSVQERYKAACEATLRKLDGIEVEPDSEACALEPVDDDPAEISQIVEANAEDSTITIDENDEELEAVCEPTHFSKIYLKTIKVAQLRQELRARNVSHKGLRAQLVTRLSKLLNKEEEKEGKGEEVMELEDDESEQCVETINQVGRDEEVRSENGQKEETILYSDTREKLPESENCGDRDQLEEMELKEKEPKTEKEMEEERKKLEKEKQTVKSRYELPSLPHIIVHPSSTAKNGKFNCSVATLSLLLDYRITDNKEHSFELFVFAELFNEMLMRDFGFYIYKTLYTLPEKSEEVKEKDKNEEKGDKKEEKKTDDKKEEKTVEKEKKDDKKDDRRDSRRRDRKDSHSDDERSSSPKRRSRGVDLPLDPYLLLSLVYFDTSRCGNITKKDLQNLFMSLGLQLSRSQIRAILEKVCIKDTFSYKTLVQAMKDSAMGATDATQDLSLETTVVASEITLHVPDLEVAIAGGNRELLPLFGKTLNDDPNEKSETKDVSDTGLVLYKSRVVDIGALVEQASKAAGERAKLETALENARAALKAARAAAASTQQAERGAQNQLSDLNAQLAAAKARVTSLATSSKIFHSTLKSIQAKVEAVVNIKYDDDDVVEVVNGPSIEGKEMRSEIEQCGMEREDKIRLPINDIDERENLLNIIDRVHHKVKEADITTTENMEIDDKE